MSGPGDRVRSLINEAGAGVGSRAG